MAEPLICIHSNGGQCYLRRCLLHGCKKVADLGLTGGMSLIDAIPVTRQRCSIEAVLRGNTPSADTLVGLLNELSDLLHMRLVNSSFSNPYILTINLPNGEGHGVHVHVNWTESGADFYTWGKYRFITLDVYTCRKFDEKFLMNWFQQSLNPLELRIGRPVWDRKEKGSTL